MEVYGKFKNELGGYMLDKLPDAGNYEYILKNDEILIKLDQYGIITAQINPPVGEAVFKREEREIGSPVKVLISDGEKVYDNFGVLSADKLTIDFLPSLSTYSLTFGETVVKTDILVPEKGKRFIVNVTITNNGKEDKKYRILKCAFPHLNELLMAPWDKPEWYTRTEYLKDKKAFLTTKFSVAGKKEERRYLTVTESDEPKYRELSLERLTTSTKNFTAVPSVIGKNTEDVLYAFKQCVSGLSEIAVRSGESYSFTQVFSVTDNEKNVSEDIAAAKKYFDSAAQENELKKLEKKYNELFSVRTVKTGNADFDKFVNGFLPLEMYWVSSLDRGWPTGMRGVRDAANDFEGMLCYDKEMCKGVIENIFSKQRSDGWYPRQVPFGSGTKFDLREFVDSACFFTEYVYDYLAYTGDYSILEKKYLYYDNETAETGLTHLKKGMDYLIAEDSLGVHRLVKMRGGDWLDCLSGVGKRGYKLFSEPLGGSFIDGIGKMGTGDFQPYFAENASVYNHGSQCFLIRALAKAGRYEEISGVLGYAMPLYADKHSPEKVCAAPYAITNCYHLVPSFYGRAGFSFLTGSVAMIERAIYSWVFGINFTLDNLVITPCVPKEYENAEIQTPFNGHKITIKYVGYGSEIASADIGGKAVDCFNERLVKIDKSAIKADCIITIQLSKA